MVTKGTQEIEKMTNDANALASQFKAMARILRHCKDVSALFDYLFHGIPEGDRRETLAQAKNWFRPLLLGDQGRLSRLMEQNFQERFGKYLDGTPLACGDPDSRNDLALYSLTHDYHVAYQKVTYQASWRLSVFSFFDELLNHYDCEPQLRIKISIHNSSQLLKRQVGHFRWDKSKTPVKLGDQAQQHVILAKYLMNVVDEKKLDAYLSQLAVLPDFYKNFDPGNPDNYRFATDVKSEIMYLSDLRQAKGFHRMNTRAYQALHRSVHMVLNNDINCKLIDWFTGLPCFVFDDPEDIQKQLDELKQAALDQLPEIRQGQDESVAYPFKQFMDDLNQKLSDFFGRSFADVKYSVELEKYTGDTYDLFKVLDQSVAELDL